MTKEKRKITIEKIKERSKNHKVFRIAVEATAGREKVTMMMKI